MVKVTLDYAGRSGSRPHRRPRHSVAGLISFGCFVLTALSICGGAGGLFWYSKDWEAMGAWPLVVIPALMAMILCPVGVIIGLIGALGADVRRDFAAVGVLGNGALFLLFLIWRLS
jgi:hypothetical protein